MNSAHLLFYFLTLRFSTAAGAGGGRWELLHRSIGVSAMHMQLLHNDRVIIFDRTDFGTSNISLPHGRCRKDPNEMVVAVDCTAHSVELDVATGRVRPLMVLTDPWCSSGTVMVNGTLVQTGGWNDGELVVRTIDPGDDADWVEVSGGLRARRWYASNQILPDGRAIVVGGRREFNYEFYPKKSSGEKPVLLMFLAETRDAEENNLYPFTHLNVDGNLFIFANNRSILYDYQNYVTVKNYPTMPGGDPRNYPSSGSSVLLPLSPSGDQAEVLVCGGAPAWSFTKARREHTFVPALNTCGRMNITDPSPEWEMEEMPMGRTMGDMILLPSGQEVLIINGAGKGTSGWECGEDPVLTPLVYRIGNPAGSRFSPQAPASTPRLYHSTAILLRDGRVLVGGSNPHVYYNFTGYKYPTDLSLEVFLPDYMSPENAKFRPRISGSGAAKELRYGKKFSITFSVGSLRSEEGVWATMVAPPFTTHAFSMNQRLLILETGKPVAAGVGETMYTVTAVAPKSGVLAPAGYYMVFLVNGGIPSEGIWTHIQ